MMLEVDYSYLIKIVINQTALISFHTACKYIKIIDFNLFFIEKQNNKGFNKLYKKIAHRDFG